MFFRRTFLGTLTLAGAIACKSEGARVSRPAGEFAAALDTSEGTAKASIIVTGFSSDELQVVQGFAKDADDTRWRSLFTVSVADAKGVPILGRYSVNDSAVRFTPQFPLDAGRTYELRVDARGVGTSRLHALADLEVELPAGDLRPQTWVLSVSPSSEVLPANLLRLYVEFSGPMSRTSGIDFMKLLDDKGQEVKAAFLPLDADFWNHEHTRYTAFLDPGRVKRGILPNEQMGRALIPGRKYSIVIDSMWRDDKGRPLVARFRKDFRVGAAEERRIDYNQWKLSTPKPGSRDTLVVTLDRSLDNGLLKRSLGIQSKAGVQIAGTTQITRNETEWRFVPDQPWRSGDHNLVIFSFLEDAAGNRVDGAFEVDMFNQVDKAEKQERYLLGFTIF